jgi:hypothetical protein
VLCHVTVGVNGVSSFHHDLIVVDEDRAEGLISPGSSFDRKLDRSTKEAGIGFRERHAASVSGSVARTVEPRTYPVRSPLTFLPPIGAVISGGRCITF